MMKRLFPIGAAAIAALSAACVVGPNYVKPTLPTPDTIRGSQPGATDQTFADANWWEVFQDDQLRALVRTALSQNEDLRLAAARILEAQAQLGITRADQYPDGGRRSRRRRAEDIRDRHDAGQNGGGDSRWWNLRLGPRFLG